MTDALSSRRRAVRWSVAMAAVILAWVLLFTVPILAGDPLPPDISFSQFGIGPRGWLFSIWAILLPIAAWSVVPMVERDGRTARILLVIGTLGCLVMAIVRTDEGGLQASTNAQIHTTAAVLAMFGIPYACVVLLWFQSRAWRVAGSVAAVVHTVSVALLLLAAAGLDTAGMGASRSWAWWQFVAITADHVLVTFLVLSTVARVRSNRILASIQ